MAVRIGQSKCECEHLLQTPDAFNLYLVIKFGSQISSFYSVFIQSTGMHVRLSLRMNTISVFS